MKKYDHKRIERKWQDVWEKKELYKADDKKKDKEYILVEFPYPSGDGLHVGHARPYTAMDIVARKRRAEGKNVLFPIGWDAFGLPTENYAIKTGTHPKDVTKNNTDKFRAQIKSIGISFDWSREINTTDPTYYKWTQWIFLQLYKKGLAYKAKMSINWCLTCKIGLANEEVVDGKCERCGGEIDMREKEQWMLAITKYADRLHDDLEDLDYTEAIKIGQRNWIGRSEGAEITFDVKTKSDFILLHGYTGSPTGNFLPWLKKELESRGYKVQVPELPNTDNPTVPEQVEYVLKNITFSENTILLGHSLSGPVALKVIEKLERPIQKLVLVAGFLKPESKDHDRPFANTFDWEFDFDAIRKNVCSVVILRAENDSAVSHEQADKIQNAIGGVIVDFVAKKDHVCAKVEPKVLEHTNPSIKVFTTRPDTLFGATYMVLAPEHSLVQELKDSITNLDEVLRYIEVSAKKSEIERTDDTKEKTGVELKGVKAINPGNNEEIPIYIADYVMAHYGTGAIMAVPAHDERDYEFAKKFELPIRQVVALQCGVPNDNSDEKRGGVAVIYDPKTNKFAVARHSPSNELRLYGGGVGKDEDMADGILREVEEESGFHNFSHKENLFTCYIHYYNIVKKLHRRGFGVCLLLVLKNKDQKELKLEEHENFTLEWISSQELKDHWRSNNKNHDYDHWILFLDKALARLSELSHNVETDAEFHFAFTGEGVLINSGEFDGMGSYEAQAKITKAVGGKQVTTYKLRDWVFSRQRYWGEPIPMIHCKKCDWVPVPEDQLPVELPEIEKYEPTDSGESPLANISDFVNVKCPKCGGRAHRETDTMPNWAGSSWYFLRYADPTNAKEFANKKLLKEWMPVDWYNGGMEHTTLHLLYSRFWHKFLYDQKLVSSSEPYKRRTSHGLILAEGGEKMSKSKGNVVNPNEVIDNVGADTLRVYEMFMGPFDQAISWSTDNMVGSRRFLDRVWRVMDIVDEKKDTESIYALLHRTIKKVSEDVETMKFNTAVSSLMIFINEIEKEGRVSKSTYRIYLQLLAPFAPHITEELWEKTGEGESIHKEPWPKYDASKIKENTYTVAVQVNGKLRGEFEGEGGLTKEQALEKALLIPNILKWTNGKKPKRLIYVPKKLINIVI